MQKSNVNEGGDESETFMSHLHTQTLATPRYSRMLPSMKFPTSKRMLLQKMKFKHLTAPLFRTEAPKRNPETVWIK